MKNVVVVDIDGTVSLVGDRLKYLHQDKPDWDKFYECCFQDEPNIEIVKLVKLLMQSYRVVFCTGRRDSVRDVTQKWLADNGLYGTLLMRPSDDHRHDTTVKVELLAYAGIPRDDIAFVLEDRNSVVAKWRELGVICLQVSEGDF